MISNKALKLTCVHRTLVLLKCAFKRVIVRGLIDTDIGVYMKYFKTLVA